MHCTATIVVVLFSVWEKWCYCYCRRPLCIRPNGSQKGIPSTHFMFRSKERLQPYLASGKKCFYNIKIDWLSNFPSEIKRHRTCLLLWKKFFHFCASEANSYFSPEITEFHQFFRSKIIEKSFFEFFPSNLDVVNNVILRFGSPFNLTRKKNRGVMYNFNFRNWLTFQFDEKN